LPRELNRPTNRFLNLASFGGEAAFSAEVTSVEEAWPILFNNRLFWARFRRYIDAHKEARKKVKNERAANKIGEFENSDGMFRLLIRF